MSILKAAAAYFATVFGVGFVLGTIRMLWVVPRLGERNAELVEAPFMLLAVLVAARVLMTRMSVRGVRRLLATGLLALGFLVAAEIGVVLLVREQSIADYAGSRDTLSGTVYLVSLAFFAAAPALVGREGSRRSPADGEAARRASGEGR